MTRVTSRRARAESRRQGSFRFVPRRAQTAQCPTLPWLAVHVNRDCYNRHNHSTSGDISLLPFCSYVLLTIRLYFKANENKGYFEVAQPAGLALELNEYQRQTVRWMLDQETLELGLNGLLWQKRAFPHDGGVKGKGKGKGGSSSSSNSCSSSSSSSSSR